MKIKLFVIKRYDIDADNGTQCGVKFSYEDAKKVRAELEEKSLCGFFMIHECEIDSKFIL